MVSSKFGCWEYKRARADGISCCDRREPWLHACLTKQFKKEVCIFYYFQICQKSWLGVDVSDSLTLMS